MKPEKVLQGLLLLRELSVLVTCTVLMNCLPMVCNICWSMFWTYNPSAFVLVTYVVCNFFSHWSENIVLQRSYSWCQRICGRNAREWSTWSEWPWAGIGPEWPEWTKWTWSGIVPGKKYPPLTWCPRCPDMVQILSQNSFNVVYTPNLDESAA